MQLRCASAGLFLSILWELDYGMSRHEHTDDCILPVKMMGILAAFWTVPASQYDKG